jgi:hypothetical protein
LKDFVPDHTLVFHELPRVVELNLMDAEPEAISDRMLVKKGNAAIPQGLIKWKFIDADAVTWEDLSVLRSCFPAFTARGQALAPEGGSVTPQLIKT